MSKQRIRPPRGKIAGNPPPAPANLAAAFAGWLAWVADEVERVHRELRAAGSPLRAALAEDDADHAQVQLAACVRCLECAAPPAALMTTAELFTLLAAANKEGGAA